MPHQRAINLGKHRPRNRIEIIKPWDSSH